MGILRKILVSHTNTPPETIQYVGSQSSSRRDEASCKYQCFFLEPHCWLPWRICIKKLWQPWTSPHQPCPLLSVHAPESRGQCWASDMALLSMETSWYLVSGWSYSSLSIWRVWLFIITREGSYSGYESAFATHHAPAPPHLWAPQMPYLLPWYPYNIDSNKGIPITPKKVRQWAPAHEIHRSYTMCPAPRSRWLNKKVGCPTENPSLSR